MSKILHLRCRHCGELLLNRTEAYCPPCNLYLCYRALPLILGALMTGDLPLRLTREVRSMTASSLYDESLVGYECDEAIAWE